MAYNGYYANRDNRDKEEKKLSEEEVTCGQTETFLTRNVKLITALVTIGVLLALIGPWSVIRIVRWVQETNLQAEKEETMMDENEMAALVQHGDKLTWADFDGFYYETLWDGEMCIRQYDVLGGAYHFVVSAVSPMAPLDSVLFVRKSDWAEIDLIKEDGSALLPK